MSARRVDIRTTRKARPVSDLNSPSASCDLKKVRSRVFSGACRPQRTIKKKSPSSKQKSPKNIALDLSVDEIPQSDEATKSRRRRLDANDYIRRRFLYDDSIDRLAKSKQANTHKRALSRDMKFRNSPVALMAASSENLQKKRRKFHDRTLTSSSQSYRCRRGRRAKFLVSGLVGHDKPFGDTSLLDGDSSNDERFSIECGDQIDGTYSDRNAQIEHDENSHLLKPLFRKAHKSTACRHDGDPSDALQNHPDYSSGLPGFFLNDDMNDFTRSRGPLVLSKRARHRLVPLPSPPRNDFMKQMTEFQEFGLSDGDEAFRHKVHGTFSLDQVVPATEANTSASAEWSGHLGESADPNSVNSSKQTAVEMEDFAGDLLPQISTGVNCPPTSGSSRRKSPIRPMQVLRNEPILYNAENSGSTGVSATGANLIQQKQLVSSFSQPSGSETVSTVAAGLVDLCAAAGLDSTASNQTTQLSHISAECTDSGEHPSQSIITNMSQYSLINSNLVSLQPGGRVFVEAGPQNPLAGYTVTPSTPVSRVSLMSSRYNYGQPYTLSRISHPTSATKSASGASGSANPPSTSSSRRRPTILKRGVIPTSSSSINPVSKVSTGYNVPRLSPPFMRTALRSVQASSLVSGAQQSARPVTYTIVSAAASGQPNVIAVAPTSVETNSSTSQTASSRLFGIKRNVGTPPAAETRPVSSFSSSNLTLISCLPTSSLVSSAQQPVRYAFVRGASDGKKYVLLGGNTNLGVTNCKSSLHCTETADKEARCANGGVSCGLGDAFLGPAVVNTPAFYSRTASSDSDVGDSNQNMPPKQATAMVS
ncbi:unnamed protein product [Hydatigera taeniaeformis]|uniref:Non-specific serine/threonine protein kinase n=1 Tax=Hydatigena taeniaeformis TaxID=6205 RepID=A0A0R3WIV5_HYDTA|nr:unnamed protein product [Hydatigera taeniaeformis]